MSDHATKETIPPKSLSQNLAQNPARPPSRHWLSEPTPPGGNDAKPKAPVRLRPRPKFDVADIALPAFAVATGAMVGLSAPYLIDPVGITGWVKIAILTGSATLVSYIVNRYAVEQGADLAARGYLTAGIVSVGSILIVGGGLFASTYAGLTIERVNDLKLQQHGQHLVLFVDAANSHAATAVQSKPIIDATVADIKLHVACEASESCLSGRGNGGRGPVTRALEPIASRSEEISSQLHKGNAARSDLLGRLNGLIGDYQTNFANSALGASEKRRLLSRIDARLKQEVSALGEVMPVALLRAYGEELQKGVTVAGRPQASANINALLQRHGRSVSAAINTIPQKSHEKKLLPPSFPAQVGVSSTFAYMGHFLPIAALTAVIELVMPLTLWVYMLLSHLWRNYRDDPIDPPLPSKAVRLPHHASGSDRGGSDV